MNNAQTIQPEFVFTETNYTKFLEFHTKHPRVYMLFEKFSKELIQAGATKIGGKLIWERMRWEVWIEKLEGEDFRLNNNYVSHYVRFFIRHNPEYENRFELRTLKAV